jgi:DNA-binding LacI/PurR family transcriptional regulator/biotin operon repressor
MLTLPPRKSLVAYTVEALQNYLATLPTGQKIPGERELADQLAVSRTTLRNALQKLERDGLPHARQRHRRVITAPKQLRRPLPLERDVIMISPMPLFKIEPRMLILIDALRETLAKERHQLEVICRPACYGTQPQRALEELTAQHRPSAWVLFLSTRAMQEWFVAHRLPTVIAGTSFEGVHLPSVDRDNQAVVRHAVGQFISRGHRSLALVIPQSGAAGDVQCEAAFQKAAAVDEKSVEATIMRHDGTVPGLCTQLNRLLAKPRPPTAFLVCRPGHALTALGYLIQRGIRFPKEAAFISRDSDSYLEHVVPSMARYRMDRTAYARKLTRIVVSLTSGGNPPARQILLMPDFVPGETFR